MATIVDEQVQQITQEQQPQHRSDLVCCNGCAMDVVRKMWTKNDEHETKQLQGEDGGYGNWVDVRKKQRRGHEVRGDKNGTSRQSCRQIIQQGKMKMQVPR